MKIEFWVYKKDMGDGDCASFICATKELAEQAREHQEETEGWSYESDVEHVVLEVEDGKVVGGDVETEPWWM